jgi:hypothetical protein
MPGRFHKASKRWGIRCTASGACLVTRFHYLWGCKYTLKLHFWSFLTVASSCFRTNSGYIHRWNIAYTRGGVIFLLRKFYWRAIQKPARKWSEIRLRTAVAKFVL